MKAAAIVLFLAGLGCALTSASCSDRNACAASDAAGAGGSSCVAGNASAGSGGATVTSCAELTAFEACLSTFCKGSGAGSPFCTCFTRGFDLGASCTCVKFDTAAFCQNAQANGIDASSLDCSVVTSQVATMCVGVQ